MNVHSKENRISGVTLIMVPGITAHQKWEKTIMVGSAILVAFVVAL